MSSKKWVGLILVLLIVGAYFFVKHSYGPPGVYMKDAKDRSVLFSVGSQLKIYKDLCGMFPSTDAGLAALLVIDAITCPNVQTPSPLLEAPPLNKWGYPILYKSFGNEILLFSLGKDNKLGGVDDDADLFFDPIRKLWADSEQSLRRPD